MKIAVGTMNPGYPAYRADIQRPFSIIGSNPRSGISSPVSSLRKAGLLSAIDVISLQQYAYQLHLLVRFHLLNRLTGSTMPRLVNATPVSIRAMD